MLRVDRALIHLDDVSLGIDQEGCGKEEVAVPIEYLVVENVVNSGRVFRSSQDREGKLLDAQKVRNFSLSEGLDPASSTLIVRELES